MKIVIVLLILCSVFVLGYANYIEAQTKKRQELNKIVNEAEHSLKTIQHNPNLRHTHLAAYDQKN